MKFALWLGVIGLTALAACKKDDDKEQTGILNVQVGLKYDGDSWIANDTTLHLHPAGYRYRVSTLQFYLSGFEFTKADGHKVFRNEVFYLDAADPAKMQFALSGMPTGQYTQVKFMLGIDSSKNIPNGLPATADNIKMIWPVMMGGGYHFMKLEGYYSDSGKTPGFAMHLGKNGYQVQIEPISLNLSLEEQGQTLPLTMNLNEWFRNPEVYDFNKDGNYSMGVSAAMAKLRNNGADVFKP